jgi:intracellular septation protein
VKKLIFDVLSGLLFMVVVLATKNIYWAFAISLTTAVGQLVWNTARRQEISAIQWASVVLIVIAGATSLFTGNTRYIMLKPALVELGVGIVMLRRNWVKRYLSEKTIEHLPDAAIAGAGYTYSFVMLSLGGVNTYLALNATQETWAVFNGLAPPIVFALVGAALFLFCRRLVRRAMRLHATSRSSTSNPVGDRPRIE